MDLPQDTGGIAYHKYVALLVSMRDAPSVQIHGAAQVAAAEAPGRSVADRFDRVCSEYGRRVGAKWPYYAPASFLALGFADVCAVTLLDELDNPFLEITSQLGLPIQRATLALCPTLESLGVEGKTTNSGECPFVELKEFVRTYAPPRAESEHTADPSPAEVGLPKPSPTLEKLPLLVVTRFKLSGLATLSRGVTFQRATFEAVGRRVLAVCDQLCGAADRGARGDSGTDDGQWRAMNALELARASRCSLQCAFFDPLDSNDVGIVLACQNFSLAAAIICAIQGITFESLLPYLPGAPTAAGQERDQARRTFEKLNADLPNGGAAWSKLPFKGFDGNHVVASSYSIPCVRFEDFESPSHEKLHGSIEVDFRLRVNPGHEKEVDEKLRSALAADSGVATYLDGAEVRSPAPLYYRVLLGPYDFTCSLATHVVDRRYRVLPLWKAIEHLRDLLLDLRKCPQGSAPGTETGFSAICSRLSVPIPLSAVSDVLNNRHQSIMDILGRLSRTIVQEAAPVEGAGAHDNADSPSASESATEEPADRAVGSEGESDDEDFARPLSIDRVDRAADQLCLPAPLRRALRYLYQNFRSCLSDSLVFDGVLDLYNAFLALEDILEGMAEEHRRRIEETDLESDPEAPPLAVDHQKVEDIAAVVDALQNAMAHRINLHPTQEAVDRAVDLRGGLNRLVSVVDVPLKCGVGVLKWWYTERFCPDLLNVPYDLEGAGITRFGFGLGATIRLMLQERIHDPDTAGATTARRRLVSLAVVNMNVAHLFHPADFTTYIHEAAHQIYAILTRYDPAFLQRVSTSAANKDDDTLSEVFADFITHLFVFGSDWELFAKLYVCQYNAEPSSLLGSRDGSLWFSHTRFRFLRILVRGFLVTHPFRRIRADTDPGGAKRPLAEELGGYNPWDGTERTGNGDPSFAVVEEFLNFVRRTGPFFSEYERLCTAFGDSFWSDAKKVFTTEFHSWWDLLPTLWKTAVEIYRGYANMVVPWSDHKSDEALREWVQHEFNEERVPDFERYVRRFPLGEDEELKLREFVLFCEVVYSYVKTCYGAMDAEQPLHVARTPSTRSPNGGNKYFVDRRSVGLVCSDPDERARRLQRKVLVLKCLWDLSTRQRARRLVRMLGAAQRARKAGRQRDADLQHGMA
jgi:hypothetical protein